MTELGPEVYATAVATGVGAVLVVVAVFGVRGSFLAFAARTVLAAFVGTVLPLVTLRRLR